MDVTRSSAWMARNNSCHSHISVYHVSPLAVS